MGDFEALHTWSGDSDSYSAACELLERRNPSPFAFAGAESVVWDFGGPGTGEIIVPSESHVSVVRIWPDASWTADYTASVMVASATARFGTTIMTHVTITSGYLLALWAPENASAFSLPRGAQGVPGPGLSIGDGGAYVRIPWGRYEVTACEWQTDLFDITKLDLRRTQRGDSDC